MRSGSLTISAAGALASLMLVILGVGLLYLGTVVLPRESLEGASWPSELRNKEPFMFMAAGQWLSNGGIALVGLGLWLVSRRCGTGSWTKRGINAVLVMIVLALIAGTVFGIILIRRAHAERTLAHGRGDVRDVMVNLM